MTNDDLKRFYPVNGNQDKPESFVRYDKDGNIPGGGSGGAQIEKLDLVVGDPEVIYDTTDGITITSQGQITQGGTTYNVDVEQNMPIIAGEGITIDASEDGKAIVVKKDKLYQHHIHLSWPMSGPISNGVCNFNVINADANAYTTLAQIKTALTNYLTGNRHTIAATGYVYETGSGLCFINGIDNVSGLHFKTYYITQSEDKTISYKGYSPLFTSSFDSTFSSDNVIEL